MAEQTLSEIVINLISWIESLQENNLKYEAKVESLTRDLAEARNSNQELEAKLSQLVYQNENTNKVAPAPGPVTLIEQPVANIVHQQQICQPIPGPTQIVAQPAQILWYGTNGHNVQNTYYDQHGTPTTVYAYPQP